MILTGNGTETKAIAGLLDSLREVAASPVPWISTSVLLVPEGRCLLQQPRGPVGPDLLPWMLLPRLCQKSQG